MRIAVGMSGGVDSTVAAGLLRSRGHEVIGLTMQVWDGSVNLPESGRPACFGPGEERELREIRGIADRLGIRHHAIPLATAYKEQVLDYFRHEYLAGRTPNPCVRCNHTMKFGLLVEAAREAGIVFDIFATGHYARVHEDPATGRHLLCCAVDASRDQSYFLAQLRQDQLAGVMFPLGGLRKTEVRRMAVEMGFGDIADQPESQDFIGCGGAAPLFEGIDAGGPGPVVDLEGRELGRHKGIFHYTVGQRKGLNLGGCGEPLYVIAIDAAANTVVVGPHEALLADGLVATGVNWIAIDELREPRSAGVRIRRHARVEPAELEPVNGAKGKAVRVVFGTPQTAVTPGQAAVFYDGDIVLGGGWIAEALGRGPRGGHG